MRKIILCIVLIFIWCIPAHAFNVVVSVKQNIYSNERFEDAQEFALQLKAGNFFLFGSYEETYLRLVGQNVGDWRMVGVGIGYNYKLAPSLSLQLSPGVYFTNVLLAFDDHTWGIYNEGIHRHLSNLYGERLWNYYDVDPSTTAVGFSIGLKWNKEIRNFLIGASFGYRYLRIPVNIMGWDTDPNTGWHDLEIEDLSCASIGLTFGYRF